MEWLKRYGIAFLALALAIVVITALTWASGLFAVMPTAPRQIGIAPSQAITPLVATPIARYARIDNAFFDVLEAEAIPYQQNTLRTNGADILAVGAYLPRTGDTLFEFVAPTATPTPLPFPTSPPLPLPAIAGNPMPTLVASDGATIRTLPYGGDACAPSGMPVAGVLTQRFHAYHGGVDWGVPIGTPVIATHSGVVTFAGWSDVGYGYLVIVQNGQFITYYAHNTSFNVTTNQLVGKGSILAWSGSTGNSTGPHVHYETRINDVPVDPLTFEARGYPSC